MTPLSLEAIAAADTQLALDGWLIGRDQHGVITAVWYGVPNSQLLDATTYDPCRQVWRGELTGRELPDHQIYHPA